MSSKSILVHLSLRLKFKYQQYKKIRYCYLNSNYRDPNNLDNIHVEVTCPHSHFLPERYHVSRE